MKRLNLQLSPEEFLALPPSHLERTERHFHVQINRNILIAALFSVLLHVLFFWVQKPILNQQNNGAVKMRPLSIVLAPAKKPDVVAQTVPQPIPEPQVVAPPPPKKVTPVKKVPTKPKVIAQAQQKTPEFTVPTPQKLPEEMQPEVAQPKPQPVQDAPTDMMALVKAKRAERLARGDAGEINASAVGNANEKDDAQNLNERIKQNIKSGTNGIFEITSLSRREATFAFRGWTGDYSNARLQFFSVEAQSGQDIRLVMIRRMIALIREHYQGDFIWESHRLGRAVKLSARMEDNAGLEDFLMTEFFGSNYKNQ